MPLPPVCPLPGPKPPCPQISYAECNGVIPQDVYDKACIFNLEEAIESCNKIGCAPGPDCPRAAPSCRRPRP
jgi:hypothetical protein